MIKAFIPLLLFMVIAHANAQTIMSFQPPYDAYMSQLGKSPESTLETLLKEPPSEGQSNLIKAQYFIVLSETYYYLNQADKVITNIVIGLTNIDEQTQPWLFHYAKVLQAQSYADLNEPRKGLKALRDAVT